MQLLELKGGKETTDETYIIIVEFGETILERELFMQKTYPILLNRLSLWNDDRDESLIEQGLAVEEVDKLTDPFQEDQKARHSALLML